MVENIAASPIIFGHLLVLITRSIKLHTLLILLEGEATFALMNNRLTGVIAISQIRDRFRYTIRV
jgi:hypothetical protein